MKLTKWKKEKEKEKERKHIETLIRSSLLKPSS
jgi:hypothetical protein